MSGHFLALYKCLFYYYTFRLKGTKFVHTTIEQLPGDLHIRAKYGGPIEKIKRLQPSEGHKTLGYHPAIDGSQDTQFKILKKYIQTWVRKIQSAPLSKEDKVHAYRSYLEKKLLYILPTCSFTYQQCLQLDRIISPILFNAHGIQRNCNRNVMYLTSEFGGLKVMSIYQLQGFSKIQFLCIHTRNMDTTGELLQISNRFTQLETGLSKPFFTYGYYDAYFLATPTWTTNIWQYMTECHTNLHQYDAWTYQVPRQHDFFLMDIILRADIPQTYKEIFNRVRLNMQLLTVSDIVISTTRSSFLPDILRGTNPRSSKFT